MTGPQSAAAAVQGQARSAMQDAIIAEIEGVVLDRMSDAGGLLSKIARVRSAFSEVLGVVGQIQDIVAMAMAGYEAMTTERRMVRRVASAHAFGYWAFQHQNLRRPDRPPHDFTMQQIEEDLRDLRIARRTGNANFSSDGGLSAADWIRIWREGVQTTVNGLDTRLRTQVSRGQVQSRMQSRFGSALRFQGQTPQQIATQYRVMVICPGFGNSPTAAAGGFLMSMLQDAGSDLERDINMRLYRQFPYNPA